MKTSYFFLFIFVVTCSGCSAPAVVHYTYPDVDKISLKAAILTPSFILSRNPVRRQPSCGKINDDYKTIISDAVVQSYKSFFTDSVLLDNNIFQNTDYDIKLVTTIRDFEYFVNCGYTWHSWNNDFDIEGNLDIFNNKDDLIWSSNLIHNKYMSKHDVPEGQVINQELSTEKTTYELAYKFIKEFKSTAVLSKLIKSQDKGDIAKDLDNIPIDITNNININIDNYAVVIGIEKYRDITKADYADKDAESVKKYLTKLLGYPENNVAFLTNDRASRSDITKYVSSWLQNRVNKNSTVFVYYAGHGAPDPRNGEAYIVPYDGDPNYPETTAIPLRSLYDSLAKLPAKQIVVALDSCFSGSGGRSVLAQGARPLIMSTSKNTVLKENMAVLAATSGNQTSTSYDKAGHGMFTYFFLKTIKETLVAKKILDLQSIYDQIITSVKNTARLKNVEQAPVLLNGSGTNASKIILIQ